MKAETLENGLLVRFSLKSSQTLCSSRSLDTEYHKDTTIFNKTNSSAQVYALCATAIDITAKSSHQQRMSLAVWGRRSSPSRGTLPCRGRAGSC